MRLPPSAKRASARKSVVRELFGCQNPREPLPRGARMKSCDAFIAGNYHPWVIN